MSLTVSSMTAGYGGAAVLRDVSLVVPSGVVVALLGANGAGKTTLLRACSGQLTPTAGAVTVEGVTVTKATPHELLTHGVCHVPEGLSVFPSLTVAENLRLFTALGRSSTDETADRAVAEFPALRHKLGQLAGTLSGGEQKMVALARAYLCEPKYVLLDEVSMGLAPKIVDEIFESLRTLTSTGAAMLLVEQYVHKALELADLVYVLTKGRITFAGEAAELDADALADAYLAAASSTD